MIFEHGIVRRPGPEMIYGLTSGSMGRPDFKKALSQHDDYIEALRSCGLKVIVVEHDSRYPDGMFVEDTAVLTNNFAVITNPGASTRRGEEKEIGAILKRFYKDIKKITTPATLDGGDVMRAGDHLYVGLSARTNQEGAAQLISIAGEYGYSGSTIEIREALHLKSGVSYIENNTLITAGEFIERSEFSGFRKITVDDDEAYAANSIWINGSVLVPAGFPETKSKIESEGYRVLEIDVSEFRKLDGGLSCLSLRF